MAAVTVDVSEEYIASIFRVIRLKYFYLAAGIFLTADVEEPLVTALHSICLYNEVNQEIIDEALAHYQLFHGNSLHNCGGDVTRRSLPRLP
jgi:hypothetical protein